jgi:AraC-like DNA-binding protein
MKTKTGKGTETELILLRNWLHNLLITLEREYLSRQQRFGFPTGQNCTHEEEVRQFKILLDMHYRKQKQVGFYAKELGISEKKLAEAVSSVYGISVKKYINEKILTEAIRLLENTTLSQGEIALELGFDFTYFIKFFRKHTGMTPAKYRLRDRDSLK